MSKAEVTGQTQSGRPETTGVYYDLSDLAGFARRMLIAAVDLGLVLVTCAPIVALGPEIGIPQRLANLLAFCLAWAYLAGLKAIPLGTLGYRWAGVQLVTLQGKPSGLGRATSRFLFLFLGPVTVLIDLLWLTNDANRQALRDKLAGTYVVRRGATPAGRGLITYPTYFVAYLSFIFPEVSREATVAVPRSASVFREKVPLAVPRRRL